MRVWEEIPCPLCRRFYCRNTSCLKPLTVSESTSFIACECCGTGHYFLGFGRGKFCSNRPFKKIASLDLIAS